LVFRDAYMDVYVQYVLFFVEKRGDFSLQLFDLSLLSGYFFLLAVATSISSR
jgi:hypothetical protein